MEDKDKKFYDTLQGFVDKKVRLLTLNERIRLHKEYTQITGKEYMSRCKSCLIDAAIVVLTAIIEKVKEKVEEKKSKKSKETNETNETEKSNETKETEKD